MDTKQYHSHGGQKMGVKIAEMAGGIALLIIEAMIILAVLEISCRLFFWVREREGEGE